MDVNFKQYLYDMLFAKCLNDHKIPRGSNKSFSYILLFCHRYAMEEGNYILSSIGETLDGITTIYDA